MPNLGNLTLPPLSSRLRAVLRKLAADESHVTTVFGSNTPRLVAETSNLVEKTLIRVMEEIEKGPGSTRMW